MKVGRERASSHGSNQLSSGTSDRPRPGETLDSICSVEVLQNESGYRFNIDAVLLAHFAGTATNTGHKVLDLGTGCGVIALLLAKKYGAKKVVGLELQQSLFDLAVRNVRLNRCEQQVTMIQGDLRDVKDFLPAKSFRWIVANPPYRAAQKGRTNPNPERALARHELGLRLADVIRAAKHLLEEKGRFFAVYPASRLSHLMCALEAEKLQPSRLRLVHPREREGAKLLLLEAERGGRADLVVEPPLFLHPHRGSAYAEEVQQMLSASH